MGQIRLQRFRHGYLCRFHRNYSIAFARLAQARCFPPNSGFSPALSLCSEPRQAGADALHSIAEGGPTCRRLGASVTLTGVRAERRCVSVSPPLRLNVEVGHSSLREKCRSAHKVLSENELRHELTWWIIRTMDSLSELRFGGDAVPSFNDLLIV